MQTELISPVPAADQPAYRALYESSFPASEKKPFSMIEEKTREGKMSMEGIYADGQLAGLLISILHPDAVLIDYLAIDPAFQSQHIGSQVLAQKFAAVEQPSVMVEIEKPSATEPDTVRRAAFYERSQMRPMDFDVNLFGVHMELWVYGEPVTFDSYQNLLVWATWEGAREHILELEHD